MSYDPHANLTHVGTPDGGQHWRHTTTGGYPAPSCAAGDMPAAPSGPDPGSMSIEPTALSDSDIDGRGPDVPASREHEIADWLEYRGLPPTTSLRELIETERGTAKLAAGFEAMREVAAELDELRRDRDATRAELADLGPRWALPSTRRVLGYRPEDAVRDEAAGVERLRGDYNRLLAELDELRRDRDATQAKLADLHAVAADAIAERDQLRARLRSIAALHTWVAGEGGTRWCVVCSQDEIQPAPVFWWVAWPCPTRAFAEDVPATAREDGRPFVAIDPAMRSGRPTVNHTRLPVEAVAEHVWCGEGPVEVAQQFDISVADVLVACWYLGRYGSKAWRRRWGTWAKDVEAELWHSRYVVPEPPDEGGDRDDG